MDTKTKETDISTPETPVARQGLPTLTRLLLLIVGDALIFLLFAAIGRRSHSEDNTLLQTAITALPFAAAWFIVSPFIGAFRRNLDVQPGKMSVRAALAWLAAWPVGLLFRGVFVDHKVPPVTFAIITLISNIILLEVWRVAFAWIVSLIKKR